MTNSFPFCCLRNPHSSRSETINSSARGTVLQERGETIDSSARGDVLQVFAQMSRWMMVSRGNWTQYHLSVLHGYVIKLNLNSDLKLVRSAKLFKDNFRFIYFHTAVASFVQNLQELLVVPKKHQLFVRDDKLKQNELLAAFINLLLLLLRGSSVANTLEKELRFYLTLLGDMDMEEDDDKQVLAEIEAMANEAGRVVHSVVFSDSADPILKTTEQSLGLLLQHMDLLRANIIKLPQPRSVISKTPTMACMHSVFIINSLLSDLQNLLNREDDDMINEVIDATKMLQQDLQFLQTFVEVPQLSEHTMQVIEVAYEAEYLLNSFMLRAAPLSYFSIRFSYVLHKTKLIRSDIEEIEMNRDNIGVSEVAKKNSSARLSSQNKSGSVTEDIIVGFQKEAIDILEHLEGGGGNLQLISIFGMPGLGKTTFAKLLYNHPIVTNRFDRRSWCVVSQAYHVRNLLIDILLSLESGLEKNTIQNMEEENLVVHIHKSLKGRRYLVVLDDIWASNAWYDVRRCLPDDRNGSRILFTSRNKDGAPCDATIYYKLSAMSIENCLELLEKKIFKNELCPPQLLEIGKNIVAKCGGLPLIVILVAGILSSMGREESTWRIVEKNLSMYIFSDERSSLMHILELSYKNLPDHLKACFLYFGSFREDMEIPVEKLKCLWMAEGFVHEEERKKADDVAEEYLMELIDRSLVIIAQRRPDGRVKTCIIHDLLRALCLKISEEVKFLKLVDNSYSIYEKHQRLCLSISDSDIYLPFGLHVRSLFGSIGNLALNILNMKLLRVLDVIEAEDYKCDMNEIKLLIHLRYLAINYKPMWMGSLNLISSSLLNLEFLILGGSSASFHVPWSIVVKMMKLRYVKFPRNSDFDIDCDSSQTNNSLEFLYNVAISKSIDEEMLRCSPNLRKLKCTWEVSNVVDFSFFTQLEWLTLTCQQGRTIVDINLPLNITRLHLRGLGLPWEKISTIGRLPNLQILKLSLHAFKGKTWETRDGEFQQLMFLQLEWSSLNHWNVSSAEHFPKLRQLVLSNCKVLQEIPYEIGEIPTLQLIEVKRWCQKSLVESARQIEQEQRDYGNEEFRVIFTHTEDAEKFGLANWKS